MKSYQIKLIVKSGIYLVLFAGLVFFAILPTLNKYNANKIKLEQQTKKLATAQNDFESLVKLKKDDAAREEIKKNIATFLPDEKSTSDFVVKIESLSGELGIQIPTLSTTEPKTTVKPTATTEDDGTAKSTAKTGTTAEPTTTATKTTAQNNVEFSLNFSNNYDKVQEFILKMNTLLRLNSLESISISNFNAENSNMDFKTTGKIYYGK